MTVVESLPELTDVEVAGTGWHRRVPDLAVVTTLLWWATYLTWGTGGREPHRLSVAAGLLLLALLTTRPWEVLPPRAYALLTLIGVAAFGVALTAPTGWHGADDAATYACVGQLAAVVLAWSQTRGHRLVLVAIVVVAGGLQFGSGWLAWWGGQDLTRPFVGTFYWHNQAAIFLAAAALVGCGAVLSGVEGLSMLGWVITPLCACGVVVTTSRASQIALAAGLVLLLVAALLAPGRRRQPVLRLGALVGLCVATTLLLTSRLMFPGAAQSGLGAVTAATAARGRRESFSGNGAQRFEDWRRAWKIFVHWPLSGAGFHSFNSAAGVATTRRDGVRTAFAHNGFLQVLSDGGLLLAAPVLMALVGAAWWTVRSVRRQWRRGDLLALSCGTALLVLALHSGMDFDWSYVSLLAMFVLVLALVAELPPERVARRDGWTRAVVGVGVCLLVLSAISAWHGGLSLNVPIGGVA